MNPLFNTTPRHHTDSQGMIQLPHNPISPVDLHIHQEEDGCDGDEDLGVDDADHGQGRMVAKLRNDGWMVDGSGGWRVESRSPKIRKTLRK